MGYVTQAVRVRATDYLRVTVWTLATPIVRGSYTIVMDDETVVKTPFQIQISEWQVINTVNIPLVDGWLVDASVYNTDILVRQGEVYAAMWLVSSANDAYYNGRCLAAGYTSYMIPVHFPRGGIHHPGTGPGDTDTILMPDPGVGEELAFYIDEMYRFRVHSMSFVLQTSSASGDRSIQLNFGYTLRVRIPTPQPPSTTWKYCVGAFPSTVLMGDEYYVSAPLPYDIDQGSVVWTETENLDVQDRYTYIYGYITSWVMTGY